jgi:hypothetical protein
VEWSRVEWSGVSWLVSELRTVVVKLVAEALGQLRNPEEEGCLLLEAVTR